MVLLATVLHAGEPKITETDSAVIVEYDGSPTSLGNTSALSDPADDTDNANNAIKAENAMMVKAITAQMELLKSEATVLLKLTGRETEEELAQKKALAGEKYRQIEAYAYEIGQLTGKSNSEDPALATEEQPQRPLSYRQEKKQRIRELKKLRMFSPPAESQ
jgi:hypothetical protein